VSFTPTTAVIPRGDEDRVKQEVKSEENGKGPRSGGGKREARKHLELAKNNREENLSLLDGTCVGELNRARGK